MALTPNLRDQHRDLAAGDSSQGPTALHAPVNSCCSSKPLVCHTSHEASLACHRKAARPHPVLPLGCLWLPYRTVGSPGQGHSLDKLSQGPCTGLIKMWPRIVGEPKRQAGEDAQLCAETNCICPSRRPRTHPKGLLSSLGFQIRVPCAIEIPVPQRANSTAEGEPRVLVRG